MKLFSKILITFCLLFVSIGLHAQQTLSAVGLVNFPSIVTMNDTMGFDIVIRNDDPNSGFTGNIDIRFITDYMMDSLFVGDTSMYSFADTIQPSSVDTIHIGGFTVSPAQFRTGDNAILIWPKSNFAGVGDTISHTIKVLSTSAIIEHTMQIDNIILYPNPVTNVINFLLQNKYNNIIEKVRIYDVLGNLEYESLYKKNTPIDIHNLSQGIYMLEIRLSNGENVIKKIIKQ